MNGTNGDGRQAAAGTQVLNRLLALLQYSLASYLGYARPWTHAGKAPLLEAVRRITADHDAHAQRVGRMILERRGKVELGCFPTGFTAYNDLALDYLARRLVEQQRELIREIAACAADLGGDPEASRLAEEIVAGEKQHLRTLTELVSPPFAGRRGGFDTRPGRLTRADRQRARSMGNALPGLAPPATEGRFELPSKECEPSQGETMSGDIIVGKVAGIPFRLHWSWFLAVFLIAWTLAGGFFPQTLPEYGGEVYWALGLVAALGLFVSVLLHELGHAFVARRFGIPVRGIRLFVFGGVAELGSEPKKPGQEILLALGGPAVTLLLIVLFHAALGLLVAGGGVAWDVAGGVFTPQDGTPLAAGGAALLYYLGMINTGLLLFNLVPAFPLDGGRVLRGAVWSVTGDYLTGTRVAGWVGIAFSWLLFAAGLLTALRGNILGGVWLFFLGTFLQNAARSGIAYGRLQQLLDGVRVADVMRRSPAAVEAGLTLQEVVDQFFLRYPYTAYPVVQGGKFVGVLTLRDMQGTNPERWGTVRAGDLAGGQGPVPVVHPQEPVLQALGKLARSERSRLPVVEDGLLVGLLCARDVTDLAEIRAGLARPPERPTGGDGPSRGYPPSNRLNRVAAVPR